MWRLGGWEIGLILVVILLVFGSAKLPAMGKGLAEFLRNFKKGIKEVKQDTDEIRDQINDIDHKNHTP